MQQGHGLRRVGIDVGGSFTDLLLVGEDGVMVVGNELTTPAEPADGIERVLDSALTTAGIEAAYYPTGQ